MQCCKKNEPTKENNSSPQKQHSCGGGLKHMLMMFACCLAPVVGIYLLTQSGYEGAASYLMFLLCPIMHLFMMKSMRDKKQETVGEGNNSNN